MSPAGGGSTANCKISSNGGGQEKINNRSPPPLEIFCTQLHPSPASGGYYRNLYSICVNSYSGFFYATQLKEIFTVPRWRGKYCIL